MKGNINMTDNEHTPLITRERLGQIASIIGAATLILGFVLWLYGAQADSSVLALLGIGVAALLAWGILTPDDARALLRRRQVRHSTMTAFSGAVLIGALVGVYLLAERANIAVDMTLSREYSLTPESEDVIARLERPVQITGFYSSALLHEREIDEQYFNLYTTASNGKITVKLYDPDLQRGIAEAFGVRYDGDIFVSYLNEDGSVDFDSTISVSLQSSQERNITRALLLLSQTNRYRVAFEIGYSRLAQDDTSPTGLSAVLQGMEASGITIGAINLRNLIEQGGFIPNDVDVLVMTQMVEPLPLAAVGIIDRYVKGGGKLFIMADVDLAGGVEFMTADAPLNDWLWRTFGLRVGDGVVVDPLISGRTAVDILSVAITDNSELTANLNDPSDQNTSVEFTTARPIIIDNSPPVPNGLIIAASPSSYSETNLEFMRRNNESTFDINEDLAGPIATAAWADNPETGARVVLVGDDDWVQNRKISAPFGNSIFFTNVMTWLTGMGENIVFSPQASVTNIPTLFVSGQMLDQIGFVTVVVMPGGVLLTGIVIWWVRSRRV